MLAIIATIFLINYVAGAEQRAMAGTETVDILVAGTDIPAGTKTEAMAESVAVESYPVKLAPEGAIASLEPAAGRVSAVDLLAGEPLVQKQLITPDELVSAGSVDVPEGMEEVTLLLKTPQSSLGGSVRAGDTVGVYASFPTGAEGELRPTTHIIAERVLVTEVKGAPAPRVDEEGNPVKAEEGTEPIPENGMLVTVARDAADAERFIYAQEFGALYLTEQNKKSDTDDTRIVTGDEVYNK